MGYVGSGYVTRTLVTRMKREQTRCDGIENDDLHDRAIFRIAHISRSSLGMSRARGAYHHRRRNAEQVVRPIGKAVSDPQAMLILVPSHAIFDQLQEQSSTHIALGHAPAGGMCKEAAERLSKILNGKLREISLDKLINPPAAIGRRVEIRADRAAQ